MTPYYDHNGVTIYHGDCREVVPQLGRKFDLLLTDVPYGKVNRESGGLRNLKKGSANAETFDIDSFWSTVEGIAPSVYVWCGFEQVSGYLRRMKSSGMTIRPLVWEKTNPSPMNGERLWLSGLELCAFGRSVGAYFNRHCKVGRFLGPSSTFRWHRTPKPVWLFKEIVDASCSSCGDVIDTCMGSGTALLAAKDLGRCAVGIDIDERCCEIAAQRLSQEVIAFPESAVA